MGYPLPIREMTREEHRQVYTQHRLRYLPGALQSARQKVRMLENEALRYGMTELLECADG